MKEETSVKRTVFKIPLQAEVQKYIQEKKGWPEQFCRHYAEKFWSFYQSNGWKVSGRAAMKDWKAAFNSNWQNLKFKEDIDFLNKCMAKEPMTPSESKTINYLNDVLKDHAKYWHEIPDERYATIYDYMKERKMIRMSADEKTKARETCNGNIVKGKSLAIKMIFDRMITNGERFI